MKLIIVSQYNDIWRIIENGNYIPRVEESDYASAKTTRVSWVANDKANVLLNWKGSIYF